MAQVFLSYDREDESRARAIAQALERAGHAVWWDLHIKGGAEYAREIEAALGQADAVVVLWSSRSIDSAWVRDEAASGRDSGRLVPLLIEAITPPMGFRQYQNIDFSNWKGRGRPSRMAELLTAIEALSGPADRHPMAPSATAMKPATRRQIGIWPIVAGGALLALLVAAFLFFQGKKGSDEVYTVAVSAADTSARPLARDLLVNLGKLQSARTGSVRLINGAKDETGAGKPDLIFEAASDNDPNRSGASLVMMDGADRSVLWSRDFDQPSGKLADLKQQMAFGAARVLECALEGLTSDEKLNRQTLKDYLTACSIITETGGAEPTTVIALLRKVLAKSPRFEPAWRTLLLAQAEITNSPVNAGKAGAPDRASLRRMITQARDLDPNMVEATLAEISLLSLSGYQQALQLADKASVQSPDDPIVLNTRSQLLRRVGRMRESVDDARRAAYIDPLSPYLANAYVSALFYAGRFEAARQELARIEQLWPGTETLEDVRYRYHLRYGDPKEALRIVQANGLERGIELFLNARIDRSAANLSALKSYMDKRIQERGSTGLSFVLQTSGEFGWENDLYKLLLGWPRPAELGDVADIYFRPTLAKFRSDPRFMLVAKRAGLVDYWQRTGKWPDFCLDSDLPYDCKAEAAKLG
jgi:tetratricopeptide (TPR) repeat protein